jgi:DNA repair exonuclease SbcCD ATPase subunit
MISRGIAIVAALMFVAVMPLTSSLQAQDPPVSATGKQELAQGKFQELTERMGKLMVVLQKDEPEESKLLSAGLRFVQEKKLHNRLESAGKLLRQERWDEGLVVMGKLKTDLRSLLELLQNRNADLRELLERIDLLEGFKDRVDDLTKEQQQEKEDSARAEALQRHLKDIEAQKQRAEDLLAQQKELRDATNQLPLDAAEGLAKPLENKEGELEEATNELSKDLKDLEKKDAQLKKEAKAAAGKPKAGESKPSDAKPSEPSEGKPSEGKPSDASGQAGKAAKAMGKAAESLGEKQPEPALKDQDQAMDALKQAIEELDAMAEDAARELLKLPFDQLAKKQEDTQKATDTLAKDMEKAEQGDEKGSEGKPTPGKQKVQQAVPKQRAAAGQLKELVPAKQKQQDAKEDLQAAQKALEEALAQLRQQLQDEVLRALEERFTAMLARQRGLTAQTETVDATRKKIMTASGALPTALVTKIGELAAGEIELEQEAIDALKLLEEDGTTAVFPPMVEQLREELHDVAAGLGKHKTGASMNLLQKDVEDLLSLLINALRKTIEQKEGGG